MNHKLLGIAMLSIVVVVNMPLAAAATQAYDVAAGTSEDHFILASSVIRLDQFTGSATWSETPMGAGVLKVTIFCASGGPDCTGNIVY